MPWERIPRPIDNNVIEIWLNSDEHRARLRLGIACNIKDYGGCACKEVTESQIESGDPVGSQVLKEMAEEAGYELVGHKDTRPEPLEFDDSDLVDIPGIIRPVFITVKQRPSKKRPQVEIDREAALGEGSAKRSKLPEPEHVKRASYLRSVGETTQRFREG